MARPMSKRKKKHKDENGNSKQPTTSVPEPKPEPQTDWLGLVAGLLATSGLAIIIVNNDSKGVVISAWVAMGFAVALVVFKLWKRFTWPFWRKAVALGLLIGAFGYVAHSNITERLRPSYVFVAPGVWMNNDTWYLFVNHRGSKTSYNVQILFLDADRGEFLRRTKTSLSPEDLESEQALVTFPEINPLGRGSIFAQHFNWKPFAPENSHFNAAITWRDGGVNEELEIVKIQEKWAYAMKVRDRDSGKELLRCHDLNFPSDESAPSCFPDVVKTSN
jgi:hypothetical protein